MTARVKTTYGWPVHSYEQTVNKFYAAYVDMCDYAGVPLAERYSKTEYFEKFDKLQRKKNNET